MLTSEPRPFRVGQRVETRFAVSGVPQGSVGIIVMASVMMPGTYEVRFDHLWRSVALHSWALRVAPLLPGQRQQQSW